MNIASQPSPAGLRSPLPLGLALFLLLFGATFRVLRLEFLPTLPNFAPLMAIAICGAFVLPGRLAFIVPLSALVATDLLLNVVYGVSLFNFSQIFIYACYGIGVVTGLALHRRNAGTIPVFATVAANSVLFYLVTNFFCWFGNAAYPQTATGLMQALTVGLPGWPPTWTFLRNSLVSDLLFTGLFLGVIHLATRSKRAELSLARA